LIGLTWVSMSNLLPGSFDWDNHIKSKFNQISMLNILPGSWDRDSPIKNKSNQIINFNSKLN